jgi:hypothetical protein
VEAALPSLPLSVLLENFLGFRIASLEHNASSAERILSAPFAKVRIISETNKLFEDIFSVPSIMCE